MEIHPGSFYIYPKRAPQDVADQVANTKIVTLILNQAIPSSHLTLFDSIWKRSVLRICADGGTNRLYEFGTKHDVLEKYIPDAVVGDLDSIFSHVKDFYNEKGSEINKIVDDNSTDFMKTISYINDRHGKDVVIIVFGGFGGRLDHAMHTLRILNNEVHSHRSIMVSDECITFAIPKGTTQIMFSKDFDGPACGLLPLAGPITLSTQGLRWNLDNHPSSFEGLMSTSNIIDGPKVIVDTTNTLIWTSEFRPLKQ